ncbi:Calcium-transporting ATPase, partial [Metamycoplasma alkalescens]
MTPNKERKSKKNNEEQVIENNDHLLQTSMKNGLNKEDVLERQKKFGLNKLKQTKKINPFLVYLGQFKDVLVIILLCAALLSYVLAIVSGINKNW